MNNDVIRQPNDTMVCCLNPSIFVKKVKYLYSTALGKVEQTVKSYHTLWLCLQIKPKSSISHHPQTYEIRIYFKVIKYIFLNKVLAQLKKSRKLRLVRWIRQRTNCRRKDRQLEFELGTHTVEGENWLALVLCSTHTHAHALGTLRAHTHTQTK